MLDSGTPSVNPYMYKCSHPPDASALQKAPIFGEKPGWIPPVQPLPPCLVPRADVDDPEAKKLRRVEFWTTPTAPTTTATAL